MVWFICKKGESMMVEALLSKSLEEINEEIEQMVNETVDNAYVSNIFKSES